jgi:anti-anti-sigma factor
MKANTVEINSAKYGAAGTGIRTILPLKDAVTHQNCEEIETAYEDAVNNGKTDIILDCQALTFLDSIALELIVRMHEALKNRGGALRLIALNDVCKDILVATRLINTLHIYKDIHGAIRKWQ